MTLSPQALLAVAAAAGPSLLAFNVAPSPTFLNQALALALWGWFVLGAASAPARGAGPLHLALALLAFAVAVSWGPGALPAGLALAAWGLLAAAALLAAAGASAAARPDAARLFGDFCFGWFVAGLANVAVALVQVFAPEWADGDWIAPSGYPGRAVGNLRQPNHLASLLLWGLIATVFLAETGRVGRRAAAAAFAAMVVAVVWSASRTGLVSVLMLALWGLADRRLSRPARALLLAAPLVYAAAWLGMAQWAALTQHTFGGTARLAETDISSSRFAIWRDTLTLIARQPWTGVGFGEFNLAWTLTPLPQRPTALFDHAHNLPLHLASELGLPLGALVLALLVAALVAAARRALGDGGERGLARRAALAMVVMIGWHSLLEYPLWYAYFLLPTAWAWGLAIGRDDAAASPAIAERGRAGFAAAALALVVGAGLAVADYLPVASVFSPEPGAPPLEQRIARGQRSVLFAHHADYAAVTTARTPLPPAAFGRAVHHLLDTRLMIAWAKSHAAAGDDDLARHLAARLREFRNPGADEFLAPCRGAEAAPAFPCRAPARAPGWREFLVEPTR